MKILKLYPSIDTPSRYNYQINYGIWDEIKGDSIKLENFKISKLDNYDVIFLPMRKRWGKQINLFNQIKQHRIKTIMFDNDCYVGEFSDSFYSGVDFIFYRIFDKKNNKPKNGMWLPWSIDTNKYEAKYGGSGVSFNSTIHPIYPHRREISRIVKNTKYVGLKYIKHLQDSSAAIHASSFEMTHGKVIEFASCGTQIISNRTEHMNYYFPDELIIYFKDVNELKQIIKNFKPNVEIQKELRHIVETKHDNKIRAKEVLQKIEEIL